jgi:hypothetical protein
MSCCSKLFSDEKFSMQRKDYNGDELRIDGYYYHQEMDVKYPHTTVMFFYRNGIVLFAGSSFSCILDTVEMDILNRIEIITKNKMHWGLFGINNSNLVIEEYYDNPPSPALKVMKSFYEIKNDTTIIFRTVDHPGYKDKIYNTFYHFKQFDNKPDSTNVYIK